MGKTPEEVQREHEQLALELGESVQQVADSTPSDTVQGDADTLHSATREPRAPLESPIAKTSPLPEMDTWEINATPQQKLDVPETPGPLDSFIADALEFGNATPVGFDDLVNRPAFATPDIQMFDRGEPDIVAPDAPQIPRNVAPVPMPHFDIDSGNSVAPEPPQRTPTPREPAMNLDDAVESVGVRDQERDDVREMGDVADNMKEYNRSLMDILSTMQETLAQGMADMAEIKARFHRM